MAYHHQKYCVDFSETTVFKSYGVKHNRRANISGGYRGGKGGATAPPFALTRAAQEKMLRAQWRIQGGSVDPPYSPRRSAFHGYRLDYTYAATASKLPWHKSSVRRVLHAYLDGVKVAKRSLKVAAKVAA